MKISRKQTNIFTTNWGKVIKGNARLSLQIYPPFLSTGVDIYKFDSSIITNIFVSLLFILPN